MTTADSDKRPGDAKHNAAARPERGGDGHAWRGEEVEEPRDRRDAEDGATRAEGNAPISVEEAEERDDEDTIEIPAQRHPAKTRNVSADDAEAKREEAAEEHDPKSRPPRARTL
jgi:hypothetical protein